MYRIIYTICQSMKFFPTWSWLTIHLLHDLVYFWLHTIIKKNNKNNVNMMCNISSDLCICMTNVGITNFLMNRKVCSAVSCLFEGYWLLFLILYCWQYRQITALHLTICFSFFHILIFCMSSLFICETKESTGSPCTLFGETHLHVIMSLCYTFKRLWFQKHNG